MKEKQPRTAQFATVVAGGCIGSVIFFAVIGVLWTLTTILSHLAISLH